MPVAPFSNFADSVQGCRSPPTAGLLPSCILAWALVSTLSGCATSATVEPNGSLVRHYLGYVKVAVPQAAAQHAIYTSEVTVLGLRVGDGIGIGYLRDRQVVVPLDCRLAILVATQAQLDNAISRLPDLVRKQGLCAVVDPAISPGDPS